MIGHINQLVNRFLCKEIDRNGFIQVCKNMYCQAICNIGKCAELDALKVLPFVHEFAYFQDSDAELRTLVLQFKDILIGNQNYHYSTFIKLSAPGTNYIPLLSDDKRMINLDLPALHRIFGKYIYAPKTISDILHNTIFDILSNMDTESTHDGTFNYVNCSNDVPQAEINKRLYRLLSYYQGDNPFLLQITVLTDGSSVYTIT